MAVSQIVYQESTAQQVKDRLGSIPIRALRNAKVSVYAGIDPEGMPGTYDRSVVVHYDTWFGIRWQKVIYSERQTEDADTPNAVASYVQKLIDAYASLK